MFLKHKSIWVQFLQTDGVIYLDKNLKLSRFQNRINHFKLKLLLLGKRLMWGRGQWVLSPPPTPWGAYIDAPVYGTCTHICVILEKYGPAVFVSLMCYFYLSICQYLLSLVQDEHSSENTPYPLPHPIYIYPPFTRICILSSNLHPPHFF